MFGLACAVKWTALSFFVFFAILSLVWDRAALKSAGVSRPARSWRASRRCCPASARCWSRRSPPTCFCYLGWFTGENSWNRHWADTHSASARVSLNLKLFTLKIPINWGWVPDPIRSLGSYTLQAYRFHEGLDSGHAVRVEARGAGSCSAGRSTSTTTGRATRAAAAPARARSC